MTEELEYLIKRVRQEATTAIGATDDRAVKVHLRMAVLYSGKALSELQLLNEKPHQRGGLQESA